MWSSVANEICPCVDKRQDMLRKKLIPPKMAPRRQLNFMALHQPIQEVVTSDIVSMIFHSSMLGSCCSCLPPCGLGRWNWHVFQLVWALLCRFEVFCSDDMSFDMWCDETTYAICHMKSNLMFSHAIIQKRSVYMMNTWKYQSNWTNVYLFCSKNKVNV